MATNEPEKITFPAPEYPIKVVVRTDPEIRGKLDVVFRHYFGPFPASQVTERPSGKGNFVALTYVMKVDNEAQLKDLNTDLQDMAEVLFVL